MITQISSVVPFVYPDLRTWVPQAAELPATLTRASFKKALATQDIDIRDHHVRRSILYNLTLGGFGERPYGEKDASIHFNKRYGHESAQARSRLIDVLFDAEKHDEKAPLVSARLSAAIHFMAISYYGNVDWLAFNPHHDFYTMLNDSYKLFDGMRITALGKETHYSSLLDAGIVLLTEEAQASRIGNPSKLAGQMIHRHYGAGDLMEMAGPRGIRRLWDWLDLVIYQESESGVSDDKQNQLNAGRQSIRFSLDSSRSWIIFLLEMDISKTLDSAALPVLNRFLAHDLNMDKKERVMLETLTGHIGDMMTAMARADRSLTIEIPTSNLNKKRFRS